MLTRVQNAIQKYRQHIFHEVGRYCVKNATEKECINKNPLAIGEGIF